MSTHGPAPEVTDTQTRNTDDPQALNVFMVGLIGALVMIAMIIATQGIYLSAVENENQTKLYGVNSRLYPNLESDQKGELIHYKYLDQAKGVVQIPVDRAMDLFLKELDQKKAVTSDQ